MEKTSKVFLAALSKYVEQKGGLEWYGSTIDPKSSYISEDGLIHLISKSRKNVRAKFKIEELGLSSDEINEDLRSKNQGSNTSTSSGNIIQSDTINIDLSDKRKVLGIASALTMLIGAMCPVATLPIVGSINYVANGRGDGVIIIVIALVSLFFVLTEKYKSLKYTGTASLCLMFFTLFRFQFAISKASSSLNNELAGNPFAGIAQAAFDSVGLGWGWILLISGAVALLITSCISVVNEKLCLDTEYIVPGKGGDWKNNIGTLGIYSFLIGLVLAAIFQ